MTIRVIGSDLSVHEFPDGTDPRVINSVLADYNRRVASDGPDALYPIAYGAARPTAKQSAINSQVPNLDQTQFAVPYCGPQQQAIADTENGKYGSAAVNYARAIADQVRMRWLVNSLAGNDGPATANARADGVNARPAHADFWQSMAPVCGPLQDSVADGEEGNYTGAALNAGLAASDVFLAKDLTGGLAKGTFKKWSSSHTWDATRKWARKLGYGEFGEPLHHWLITQKFMSEHPWALPIGNQPWNLLSMKWADHTAVHQLPGILRTVLVNPDWVKASALSPSGRLLDAYDPNEDDDDADY